MKIKINVYYPWPSISDEDMAIEIPDSTPSSDIEKIAFNYVENMIFDRGISWDYKEIK